MIYRHTDSDVQEYFDRIGVNQSALKLILRDGIQIFAIKKDEIMKQPDDLYYEEKEHLIIGKAVDTYLSMGSEIFQELYHFSRMITKPSATEMSVVKRVFDMVHEVMVVDGESPDEFHRLDAYPEQIYQAQNEHEYYIKRKKQNYLDDSRAATMLKSGLCQQYWQELVDAGNRQVLSDEEYIIIQNVYMSILTHKHTARLFQDNSYVDIVFQMPLYFEEDGVDCKVLIDHIIINHAVKRIMPIDEKTIGRPVLQFNKEVERRRYDIQGAFYMNGLKKAIQQLENLLERSLDGYTISNFAFVVQSTKLISAPMIYVLDDDVLRIGEEGDGEEKLGWRQALATYKEWEACEFSLEKKFESTNGVVWIGKNYKYNETF